MTEPMTIDAADTLAAGIALYTAMFEDLEAGGVITDAQLAACIHDSVLSVIYHRFCDFAHWRAQRGRLHRVAVDDSASEALHAHLERYFSTAIDGSSTDAFVTATRRQALEPTPIVRRWRRERRRKAA